MGGGEAQERAREAAREAVRLDPNSPHGYAALGLVTYRFDRDYPRAVDLALDALALDASNTAALRPMAFALRRMGRLRESIAALQGLLAVEPLSVQWRYELAMTYLAIRDVDNAEEEARRTLTMSRERGLMLLSQVLLHKGELDAARDLLDDCERSPPIQGCGGWPGG